MIYVIIVIALFAALSFMLSRNADTGEGSAISNERANIAATRIMQDAAAAIQQVEQITYGTTVLSCPAATPLCNWAAPTPTCDCKQAVFTPPSNAAFETEPPPNRLKVFHPDGGGVVLSSLPPDAIQEEIAPVTYPNPGVYMSRFSNVEWSNDDAGGNPLDDVIYVAFKISRTICERINQKLNGAPAIPTLTRPAADIFIANGSNSDFTIADCPACEGKPALCVKDSAKDVWAFYSLGFARIDPLTP